MSESYLRDWSVDDAILTPRQAAMIWRIIPESLRYRYILTLPEQLANQVMLLTASSVDQGSTHDRSVRS